MHLNRTAPARTAPARTARLLTAAALAGGIVLCGGAASAQTVNPDLRSFPTGPACAEHTLTGSVRAAVVASALPKGARPAMTVQLRWNTGGTAYTDTSVVASQSFYLQAGAGDYAFSLDASKVPATAKNLIAYALTYADAGSAPSDTLTSKVLAASSCAAAPSATTITKVDLTCSGDALSTAVALADPPTSGTVPATVAVQGRVRGATTWTSLSSKTFTVSSTTTSLPLDVSLAGRHTGEYRTRATVNNGVAVFSSVVDDATCAPAEVVPEAPAAVLIPLTLAVTAGTAAAVRRRRTAVSVATPA